MPKHAHYSKQERVHREPFCSERDCRWNDYPVFGHRDQLWDSQHWPKYQRFWLRDRWLCHSCSGGKGSARKPRNDSGQVSGVADRKAGTTQHAGRSGAAAPYTPRTHASVIAQVDGVFPGDEDDPAF